MEAPEMAVPSTERPEGNAALPTAAPTAPNASVAIIRLPGKQRLPCSAGATMRCNALHTLAHVPWRGSWLRASREQPCALPWPGSSGGIQGCRLVVLQPGFSRADAAARRAGAFRTPSLQPSLAYRRASLRARLRTIHDRRRAQGPGNRIQRPSHLLGDGTACRSIGAQSRQYADVKFSREQTPAIVFRIVTVWIGHSKIVARHMRKASKTGAIYELVPASCELLVTSGRD